ncbi:MAG: OmpA family protein [Deltaproteobacteria bacterium]|nr:OmpA family protein [Deltaproteobacteria bacterium]
MRAQRHVPLMVGLLMLVAGQVWAGGHDDANKDPTDFASPTLNGGTGLFRTLSAYPGRTFDVRVGLHFEYFRQKRFIVDNWSGCGTSCPNEANTRVQGAVTAGFTPWKYLEVFSALYSSSNTNDRHHQPLGAGERNPNETPLQMALGDFLLGVKGAYPVTKYMSVGLNADVKFLTSQGNTKPDFGATNVGFDAVLSTDFAKINNKVPLRLHLNIGYLYDRSSTLVDNDMYKDSGASSEYHHYFLVQQFALGMNRSRVRWSLGVEVPLPHLAVALKNAGYLRYFPDIITEIGMDIGVGAADKDIQQWAEFNGGDYNINGRLATRLTAGLRFKPVDGLLLDFGVDVALSQMGFAMGPAQAPWNFFFQAGYTFAPHGRSVTKTVVKLKEVVKYIEKATKPTKGTVRGLVRDSKTKTPIAQAIITFAGQAVSDVATAEDGSYMSFPFKAGKVRIEVRKDGYKPWSGEVDVQPAKTATLDVDLIPEPPKVGTVVGTLVSEKGAPLSGTVEMIGREQKHFDVTNGSFTGPVKPGTYRIEAKAPKYFMRVKSLVVEAGQKALLELKMIRRPRRMLVVVTKRKLRIRRRVHFATGKASIRPDSEELLNQIAAVLNEHSEILLIRVEGHTDNRGRRAYNMRLSQRRAESVRDYLIAQGVDPARLEAKGYGPTRPVAPNFSARNRRRNRRVEFRIMKRK